MCQQKHHNYSFVHLHPPPKRRRLTTTTSSHTNRGGGVLLEQNGLAEPFNLLTQPADLAARDLLLEEHHVYQALCGFDPLHDIALQGVQLAPMRVRLRLLPRGGMHLLAQALGGV